ncbi:hypothetical protein M405DRAFT_817585 [Rhizopogon salebrosus TDB-379]|nr:hypothetical protein M405DRAFT_817585 [Rhizopogon salebrosus TDB-379]
MGAITILNSTHHPIQVRISKAEGDSGSDDYYPLGPGASDAWSRNHTQTCTVLVMGPEGGPRSFHVTPGQTYVVV